MSANTNINGIVADGVCQQIGFGGIHLVEDDGF